MKEVKKDMNEDEISKDACESYHYAKNILHAPFKKGEKAISEDADYYSKYQTFLKEIKNEK